MKNKLKRLVAAAKEYEKLYRDSSGMEIAAVHMTSGKPSVMMYRIGDLRAAFPDIDFLVEPRDDPTYPLIYSTVHDGVLFYAIGGENE